MIELRVLGYGHASGVVERVEEIIQEGVRGLAWRVMIRLPDGSLATGIQRGSARLAFLDPRHRLA